MRTQLLIGTRKGAFILESDAARESWRTRGPFCDTWPIHHVNRGADGTLYAAGGNAWYGPTVWQSADDGSTWTQSSEGITYGDDENKVTTIWNVTPAPGANDTLYAGVEPAGLFRSDDHGQTWRHVSGLREHPSLPEWQPGAGGLILHSIAPHPTDPDHLWIAISAAGTFETTDGGRTWTPRNKGVRADFYPGPPPEVGHCVHNLRLDPTRSAATLPAEPLRGLPDQRRRRFVDRDHQGPAFGVRLPAGDAPLRPLDDLGHPAQRPGGRTSHDRRPRRGLAQPRQR